MQIRDIRSRCAKLVDTMQMINLKIKQDYGFLSFLFDLVNDSVVLNIKIMEHLEYIDKKLWNIEEIGK